MKKLFFLLLLLIGLFGCNNNAAFKQKIVSENASKAPAKPMDITMDKSKSAASERNTQDGATPEPNRGGVTKKIIREGEISFETKNLTETRKAINNTLQKLGGYIAEENESNDSSETRKTYVLKARIPEKNFEQFLESVSSGATKIDSKNIVAKDVTSDYIDYTAQLGNKKKLEERYVELLKKGTKMSDLLEIEDKITEIQTTIDSTQGQLNYLMRQVEFSSLDITFYTKPTVKDNGQTFWNRLTSAFSGGWEILVEVFFALVSIWPLWIIGAIGYFIVKAWRRKYPSKKISS